MLDDKDIFEKNLDEIVNCPVHRFHFYGNILCFREDLKPEVKEVLTRQGCTIFVEVEP